MTTITQPDLQQCASCSRWTFIPLVLGRCAACRGDKPARRENTWTTRGSGL
jgi:hypothetical protein